MKILLCHDGSKQAENAVRFGGLIAAACQAEVTLLGIVEHAGMEEALFTALHRAQQRLREKNLLVEFITRAGEPVAEIRKQTSTLAYDLVVIGAVRKESEGAFRMSAKAYKLVKALVVPVLIVIGAPQQLRSLLICSRGSGEADAAVHLAGRLGQCAGAKVVLLHVFAQPPALYADLIARLEDVEALLNSRSSLGRTLRRQKQALEELGLRPEVKLRHGPVLWELLGEMEQGRYDLVAVGIATRPSRFRTYMMGDITRELFNRAEGPLLIVPGEQQHKGRLARFCEGFESGVAEEHTERKERK